MYTEGPKSVVMWAGRADTSQGPPADAAPGLQPMLGRSFSAPRPHPSMSLPDPMGRQDRASFQLRSASEPVEPMARWRQAASALDRAGDGQCDPLPRASPSLLVGVREQEDHHPAGHPRPPPA